MTIFLLAFCSFCSCDKSNITGNNFTWTYQGITYTTDIDTAFTNGLDPAVIAAVKGTNLISFDKRIDFSLTSLNMGTYNFGAPGSNMMRCIDETGIVLGGVSGSIHITANSNNLLSGNFSALITDPAGNSKPISGGFQNLPIRPWV